MTGARARWVVEGTRFADVRRVPETGSTNDDVLAAARAGAPEGLVILADHQTRGRGRLDRSWEAAPSSAMLASVLLRPDLPPVRAHLALSAVAVATLEVCDALAPGAFGLKWPNDVVEAGGDTNGAKLAGLLGESLVERGELKAAVVGIGLNLAWPLELPDELAGTATALGRHVQPTPTAPELLGRILHRLDGWVGALETSEGQGRILAAHEARCVTLGQRVRAAPGARSVELEGVACGISPEGHLLVQVEGEDGPRSVASGDVIVVWD